MGDGVAAKTQIPPGGGTVGGSPGERRHPTLPEDIVFGQKVADEKLRLARELRRNMTPEERILWKELRAHRLGGLHFRRQQVIDGFVVDFFCFEAALVVEVDGGVHRTQVQYDAERDHALAQRGLRVLRIPNEDVRRDLAGVLAHIAEAAQANACALSAEEPTSEAVQPAAGFDSTGAG